MWTEPPDGEPGNLVERMNEAVRMMADAPRMPTDPIRLTRRQYDALRADAECLTIPLGGGVPVEIIDDPPLSYRHAIRAGLERKRR